MKTLYIECNMGAAGDMLMAALSELIDDAPRFVAEMNALNLPGVRFERLSAEKCGVTGTHMAVTVDGQEETEPDHDHDHPHDHGHEHEHEHSHDHEHEHGHEHEHEHHHEHDHSHDHEHDHDHHHDHDHEHDHDHDHHHDHDHEHDHGQDHHHDHDHDHDHDHPHDHDHDHHHHHHAALSDIRRLIGDMPVSDWVKKNALEVYDLIAAAESQVHGVPMDQIHFHEVGTLDAVADVVGVCRLMELLGADQVVVSPIHVGFGQVRCAHGVLPVPAPATALILKDVPIYGGKIRGELCTPTGAALLKHFATRFGDMPVMTVSKTGYGMGTKDFEWANCVRAMLGETGDAGDIVSELSCNLDDMTGEELAFAMDALREAGALDVCAEAIQMKKGRPGTTLRCLCRPEAERRFAELMLKHTTTIGVRCQTLRRYTLSREAVTLETSFGPVAAKRSHGYGVERVKPEFDAVSAIARREGLSVREVEDKL